MQYINRSMVLTLVIAGLQLFACQQESNPPSGTESTGNGQVEEAAVHRLELTTRAIQIFNLQTAPVREAQAAQSGSTTPRKVIPYSAVLYDPYGNAWVYTNSEPLIFVRQRVRVEYMDGGQAILSDGPPAGTEVVTVGAANLFGSEFTNGKGD